MDLKAMAWYDSLTSPSLTNLLNSQGSSLGAVKLYSTLEPGQIRFIGGEENLQWLEDFMRSSAGTAVVRGPAGTG
jgi:hypothetical protein